MPTHIFFIISMRIWRNWQTRMVQVHMKAISCRFKSCYPHHNRQESTESCRFYFYKRSGFMFINLCRELEFPFDSLSDLEKAYLSVTETPETSSLFKKAIDSLLYPNPILFDNATSQIRNITKLHPYTLNLMLCISSIKSLREIYIDSTDNLDKHLKSLKTQMISCKNDHNVWGIEEGFWQWMFHEWQCVNLGRLEFEPFYHFVDVPYKGIKKGDFVILIHIPGGSPLNMDEVMESLELGYNYFKDKFQNGVVPFFTHSWLLYPPYMNGVFKEGGNLQKFAGLFDIIYQNQGDYINFSNVFGCPYPDDNLSNIPQQTSLQRNMMKYIMQGGVMGQGYGFLLYDKNGIIRN